MKIAATFVIDADVEGWARARKITVDEATKEIFEYLGSIADNPLAGQAFLTLDSATVMEDTL